MGVGSPSPLVVATTGYNSVVCDFLLYIRPDR